MRGNAAAILLVEGQPDLAALMTDLFRAEGDRRHPDYRGLGILGAVERRRPGASRRSLRKAIHQGALRRGFAAPGTLLIATERLGRRGHLSPSISRVLYPLRDGDHLSRAPVTRRLKRPTRGRERRSKLRPCRGGQPQRPPIWPCSRWGLPSRPRHRGRWWSLTPPFHPCQRVQLNQGSCRGSGQPPRQRLGSPLLAGGLLSVALSVGSPPLAVSQHPALWSSDFPRAAPHGRPAVA